MNIHMNIDILFSLLAGPFEPPGKMDKKDDLDLHIEFSFYHFPTCISHFSFCLSRLDTIPFCIIFHSICLIASNVCAAFWFACHVSYVLPTALSFLLDPLLLRVSADELEWNYSIVIGLDGCQPGILIGRCCLVLVCYIPNTIDHLQSIFKLVSLRILDDNIILYMNGK